MDESYNKNKEKTKQQLSNEDIEVLLSDNQEYFQHKSRVSTLQSNLKNHTPYRFAFNSIAVKKLKSDNTLLGDSQRLFARRGIRPSLVAQTVEPDSERFFSDYNLLSNSSIMVDNYDFFLNNIDNIRVNLARVMLAKLDIDLNSKKTLEDILNSKEWKEASSQEIFYELKNRLRATGREKEQSYSP
jgi:hypothetical protein